MKTTIELSDALLREAKEAAARRGTTLRDLMEAGLRHELQEPAGQSQPYRMRDASVGGNGMTREFAEGGWEYIRDVIYEGRGA